MFFGIKHITDLPGCNGNAVNMATKEPFKTTQQNRSILSSSLAAHMFFVTIYISLIYLVVMETLLLETK